MGCGKNNRPGVDENYEECDGGMTTTNCVFLSNKVDTVGFDINPNASLSETINVMLNHIRSLEKEIKRLKIKYNESM